MQMYILFKFIMFNNAWTAWCLLEGGKRKLNLNIWNLHKYSHRMQVKSLEQTKRVITDLYRAILFQFRLTRLQFPDPQQWINRRPFYFGLYSVVSWSYHIITHPHNEIKMNTYMMQCIIHTRMFVCHISSYDTRDYVEPEGTRLSGRVGSGSGSGRVRVGWHL